ncbi:Dipeptidyl-peptidase 5 [Thecaphora frezii]
MVAKNASPGHWRLPAAASSLLFLTFIASPLALASKVLTPERLIEAPRPSFAAAAPNAASALFGASTYDLGAHSKHQVLYSIDLPAKGSRHRPSPVEVVYNTTEGFYLSDGEFAFLIGDVLYAKNLSAGRPDPLDPGYRIGAFPAPVSNLQLVRQSEDEAILVFSAEVYDDGRLDTVKEHDASDVEQEWSRVKAYDSNFVRHWDAWTNPRKRSQIFSVDLSRKKERFVTSWHFDSEFRNLMPDTKLESPVKPFGGADDFAVSDKFVAWTAKDPELPLAWHTKQNIYIAPLKGGEPPRKVSSGEHGWAGSPAFSPDGKTLAWLQMRKDGFESDRRIIQFYDLDAAKQDELFGTWDQSPSSIHFSKDGSRLWILSENDEQGKVYSAKLHRGHASGQWKAAGAEPEEVVGQGSVSAIRELDDERLLIAASSLSSPTELFLVERDGKAEPRQLTSIAANSKALSKVEFGPKPEQFSFIGSEGVVRHGWIVRPPGFDENSKAGYPVAVLIHGGPEGAWTNSWSTRWNPAVFAAQGFLVVTIDPAGSTGFGQKYTEAILENWGGRPYHDIRAGVHYVLETVAAADPERVVAAGASYGGYMINWIQGHNDDGLFKGLVCHDGVFSTASTWFSTDELYFPESEFGGTPWSNAAGYSQWSPSNHAGNWKTPQLVIHGGRDYRLTESEGLSAFNTLQRRGVPSRLLYFPDENHWVLKPENSLRWHEEVIGWLKKWSDKRELSGAASGADAEPRIMFQN